MRGHNVVQRYFALVLTIAMIALMIAGCGGKKDQAEEPTMPETAFHWPTSEIASQLPVPESNAGTLELETPAGMLVKMRNISKEQYDNYVDACRERGFVVDYSRSDDSYFAYNEAGYSLMLNYVKNGMSIEILAPEETRETESTEETDPVETTSPTTDSETPSETTTAREAVDGIRPEFKEAMDSYEAFMDEYVAFMRKYEDATDKMGMLTEYSDYLVKYAEAMEKIDKLDDQEWSTAETLYFTEVMTRVNKKLATIP